MKNKAPVMNQYNQNRTNDWLYQDDQDDFLVGKTPHDIQVTWEDEE